MNAENKTSCTTPSLWESIVIAALFFMYLIMLMVYIKLRKIDKKMSAHKAKRRPGLRTKKPNNLQNDGKENSSQKMLATQPTRVPLWLREQIQSQLAQHPNAQNNSCPQKGSVHKSPGIPHAGAGNPSHSCHSDLSSHSGQHSDSDDVNYTTITFPVPKQGISTVGGYRD